MLTFKESICEQCKNDDIIISITLINGINIELRSKTIIFFDDYLEFDGKNATKLPEYLRYAGEEARLIKIPYHAIAIFSDLFG